MKKRILSMLIMVCMVFTMLPTAAFATESNPPVGASRVVDSSTRAVCIHTEHDGICGYIEAVEGVPCNHLKEDGIYSCALTVSGNVASPSEAKTLSGIAVTTQPTKTTYTAGEEFDKTGMVVTATYSDSSTADVTSYITSPIGALATSHNKVTISYTEVGATKTADVSITVNEAASDTKITSTLDLTSVATNVKCTDSDVGTKITGMTQHTHTNGTPCWAWDYKAGGSTLTLNNLDLEVISSSSVYGIRLPHQAVTINWIGTNNVVVSTSDAYVNITQGIGSESGSMILAGITSDATLNITTSKWYALQAMNGSIVINEGILNVSGGWGAISGHSGVTVNGGTVSGAATTNTWYAISATAGSITLNGGTTTAKSEVGIEAFSGQPTTGNGVTHKADTGTWDNTTGAACTYNQPVTVTAVAVAPKTASVQQGKTQQFNAAVTGTNNPAQTVKWEVTGGAKSGTVISDSGLLTVAADETATSLTVKASSSVDTTKYDTATVTVTSPPVTKYTLIVTGGTGSGSFEENATVTITANESATGKVFDKWTTTDGVAFTDATAITTTFTMPTKAVTVTANYKDASTTVPVTDVTLNKSAILLYSNTNPRSETLTATLVPANATNKAVTWSSSNTAVATVANGAVTAVANGIATISATTEDGSKTASCTVTVTTYNSGGGGDSSSDGSSNITITPPSPDRPNDPTKVEIKIDSKLDANGMTTVNVTDKNITEAINKAEADAKKNGNLDNGITIVLSATGGKNATNVTVNLPKTVQNTIINKKVVSTIVVVNNPDVQIGMDLKAVTEINKQAQEDVTITAKRLDRGKLTSNAKTAIGTRPVFDFKVNYGSGKMVQNFGTGSVAVSIPYALQSGEKAGNVYGVYVDAKGKLQWITGSSYDATAKVLRFSTNNFSTYGVGYKQDAPAFTDIGGHWAKADIEFVAARDLLSGTSATTFSPNTAMTRGMFVAALGRLANANISSYKQSSFSDVKADSYYMGYIEWASKNGIVSGNDGKFMPDKSITREQMAVIMQNYAMTIGFKNAQSELPKVYEENTFVDSSQISDYAKDAVKAMQMAGVLSGKSGNLFDPQGTANRGEVSAVLRRFVELRISTDTAQGWTMNDSGKWMYYEKGKPVTGKRNIDGMSYTFDQNGETIDVPKNLGYTTHTVVRKQSWGLIAQKYGCSASELARINNKTVFDVIHPGDVLKVPQK